MLRGLRIVNLAVNLPGPAAAQRLQALGATVVKVEPPGGDPMALYSQPWYADMMEGQQVHRCDLKDPQGKKSLFALLESADALITATRSAALKRLGLDFDSLHPLFPDLCMVSIVGYPAPDDDEAGHDLTYQARMGLLDPPHMPRTLISDLAGAEQTVSAVLALLVQRERTGEAGQAVVPLSEAAAFFAEPLRYGSTVAGGILGGGLPEYNIYQARDGWVAVAALEPHFKSRLEKLLDIRRQEDYQTVFAGQTTGYWKLWAQSHDLPVETVV